MPRELRQRTSRPNYAALFQFDDEDGAGPSNMPVLIDDDAESGSDFTPAPEREQPEGDSEEDELDGDDAEEDDKMSVGEPNDEDSIVITQTVPKAQKKAPKKRVSLAPGISVRQQSSASALPNTHHRHRAISLHQRPERAKAERLLSRPSPFTAPALTATEAFSEPVAWHRVPKAWGYNVGPGPLWELMEDRGFYSEEPHNVDERESVRRPAVHRTIQTKAHAFERLTHE